MNLPAFAENVITLTTDKNSYGPGDIIKITGSVIGSPNQLVGLQVKDSNGALVLVRTVQTDSNGNFSLTFKVPSTATSGIFGIEANSKINGQTVITQNTFAQTVPEFGSIAPIILVISMILTTTIFTKIRTRIS